LGFTFQITFAENIKFKSTSKDKDGSPLILTGVLTKPAGMDQFGIERSSIWGARIP
jgi:hypothetical protein